MNPMVFGSGGRGSKVLELEMKSMLDARLRQFYSRMIHLKGDDDLFITNPTFRQTNIDPFIEMVDLAPKCSLSTNFDSSKSAFKLLPPCSDQIL